MYSYMPEMAGRRRAGFGLETRRETRPQTRLPFSLSLIKEPAGPSEAQRVIKLTGHTHDISANSISLIGPLIRFGYRYLMGRDHTLHIVLDLPSGPVELEASPVRYVQLEAGATDAGFIMSGDDAADDDPAEICCLIGVLITAMGEVDRALYDEYLSGLAGVEAQQMNFIVDIEDNLWEEARLTHSAI
jgi:hypothetical protein